MFSLDIRGVSVCILVKRMDFNVKYRGAHCKVICIANISYTIYNTKAASVLNESSNCMKFKLYCKYSVNMVFL